MSKNKEIKPGMAFKNRHGERYIVIRPYQVETEEPHFLIKFENPESWQVIPAKSVGASFLENWAKKSVCNVGYMSSTENAPAFIDEDIMKVKKRWRGMINRCYNKNKSGISPAYRGTSICNEWLDFSCFLKWAKPFIPQIRLGWDLDKDLLGEGRRLYSPDTCTFLPTSINSGIAKKYLWKDRGSIAGTAAMMYWFYEDMKSNQNMIVPAAYKRLTAIVEEYKAIYTQSTGLDFNKFRPDKERKSPKKRGRRMTEYKCSMTVRITQEAADILARHPNKSEFIDMLIKKYL